MNMKKSDIYPEKGKNLASVVPAKLANKFRSQAKKRRQHIKYSLAAAVKLWISLPPEIQAKLLNEELEPNSFIALVRQIVDERIEAGRIAARKSLERPRKKRGQKD